MNFLAFKNLFALKEARSRANQQGLFLRNYRSQASFLQEARNAIDDRVYNFK